MIDFSSARFLRRRLRGSEQDGEETSAAAAGAAPPAAGAKGGKGGQDASGGKAHRRAKDKNKDKSDMYTA